MPHFCLNHKFQQYQEKSSFVRALRGGSFIDKATYARCACRLAYDLGDFNEYVGFRVALAPDFS
jgi:formylglycine-generating enzyme required for sulfatase activity